MRETILKTDNSIDSDQELRNHLPKSLQIMIDIEDRAQAAVKDILADIAAGNTTLEIVKREMRIIT
ncbi:MAG TPA: hypothetical protein C5S50_02705 [Methanosarcinaceae archaeon]|nr:hypothetical protein [Methanosarcinaceae archaeon]